MTNEPSKTNHNQAESRPDQRPDSDISLDDLKVDTTTPPKAENADASSRSATALPNDQDPEYQPRRGSSMDVLSRDDSNVPAKFVRDQDFGQKYPDTDQTARQWRARVYSDGSTVFHGPYVEYYPDGTEFCHGQYENGKRVGEWSYSHPNGKPAKKPTYVDGLPDGTWQVFDDDGRALRQESYVKGERSGKWLFYAPDGKKLTQEEEYAHGKMNGKFTAWDAEGNRVVEASFEDGMLHGARERWHSNGERAAREYYVKGKRHGTFVSWSPNGTVISQMEFRDGKLVGQQK